MNLLTFINGDLVNYSSRIVDGSYIIESSAMGDDNVRMLYEMHLKRQMQSGTPVSPSK